MRIANLFVAMTVVFASPATAQDADDADFFKQVCGQCHSVVKGENRLGPSLYEIVGRNSASLEFFRYSRAMRDADVTWTTENIDAFIKAPLDYLPGTKMAFTGVQDPDERAAIIGFLTGQGEDEGDQTPSDK